MRAVLILLVLLAWAACLLGAVGLPVYLAVTAANAMRHRDGPGDHTFSSLPPAAVKALVVYAVAMAVAAGAMAGVVLWGREPAAASSALAWAALPLWSAVCAAVTALVLVRQGRPPVQELHTV